MKFPVCFAVTEFSTAPVAARRPVYFIREVGCYRNLISLVYFPHTAFPVEIRECEGRFYPLFGFVPLLRSLLLLCNDRLHREEHFGCSISETLKDFRKSQLQVLGLYIIGIGYLVLDYIMDLA